MKNIMLCLSMALLTLGACGDGGGGDTSNQLSAAKTTVTLKIALTGTLPSSTNISGAAFTLILPPNVTPTMTNGAVVLGDVANTGTFADSTLSPQVVYTTAASSPGTLDVILTSSLNAGVTQVGEVATITLQLANGANPTSVDFGLNAVSVIDAGFYRTINGMGVSVTSVTLQ